jgi:hypothetical protein
VLVADGVYRAGGRIVFGPQTNRVAVTKPITVQSANGPRAAVIEGYQVPSLINDWAAIRCVYCFQKPRPMAVGVGLCPCTIANKLFVPLWGPSKSPVLCTGLFTWGAELR